MSGATLLAELRQRGAVVTVLGARLRVEGPRGVLTPALKEALAVYKPELLAMLGTEYARRDEIAQVRARFAVNGIEPASDDLRGALEVEDYLERWDTILAEVQQGDGTISRLLHDPALYDSLNATSVEVREMIADFRRNPKEFLTVQLRIF